MSLRTVVVAVALLAAALLAWQKREQLQAWAGAAGSATGSRPAAALRKCVNGSQVAYTDAACPSGYRAEAVQGGTVSVLPAMAAPAPAPRPSDAASGSSALHRALDITRDGRLHEKMMERQIEGAR